VFSLSLVVLAGLFGLVASDRSDSAPATGATPLPSRHTNALLPTLPPWGLIRDPHISPTPTASWSVKGVASPTPAPGRHLIEGVPAGVQPYNLTCEYQSASDLAWFYGHPITWEQIAGEVGFDDNGDPNVAFVGRNYDDPPGGLFPKGYGVYAGPVAAALRRLGLKNAIAVRDVGSDWLLNELNANRPVIVWAPFDFRPSVMEGWTTRDGQTWVEAVRFEHTFTAIGYDAENVIVTDPWYGTQRHFSWSDFIRGWGYFHNMAITVSPEG